MKEKIEMSVLSLSGLIDWVGSDPDGDALHCDSPRGRELTREITALCQTVHAVRGVYAWVNKTDSADPFVYVGMTGAGSGKASTLQWRLWEELRDERMFLWQTGHNNLSTDRMLEKWCHHYAGNRALNHFHRGLRKAGTTHILWTPTQELSPDEIHNLERWLIRLIKPFANKRQDAPREVSFEAYAEKVFEVWRGLLSGFEADILLPVRPTPDNGQQSKRHIPSLSFEATAQPPTVLPRKRAQADGGMEALREAWRALVRQSLHELGYDWYSRKKYEWIFGRRERWDDRGVVFGYLLNDALHMRRGQDKQSIKWDELNANVDNLDQFLKAKIKEFCTNGNQINAQSAIGDRDGLWPEDYIGTDE